MNLKRNVILITIIFGLCLIRTPALAQLPSVLEISDLNGQNGFAINGESESDFSGTSVSAAGDFNGDGIDDIIIGAPFADPEAKDAAGISYVIYGSTNPIPHPFNLINIHDQNGLRLNGIMASDNSGAAVSAAGDINHDGTDDIIIGASRTTFFGDPLVGSSYVVYGNHLFNPFNLASINALNGFTITGEFANNLSGYAVSSAGDVNGDGIDDLIVGAHFTDAWGVSGSGKMYVVFGSDSVLPNPFDLATLDTFYGVNGFAISGEAVNDHAGFSVSAAGDVNGDGIDDLLIGADNASTQNDAFVGKSYVVFGSSIDFPSSLDLATINGSNGFAIIGVGTGDNTGISVSAAGDMNGDGIDDLVIGADRAHTVKGRVYVVFGAKQGLVHPLNLVNLNGQNGMIINGSSAGGSFGNVVSSAGDINADGIADIIIGAKQSNSNGNSSSGISYVVYGNDGIFSGGFE